MGASGWDVPETDVLETVKSVLETDADAVLATVTDVRGSAYRRPGAKMVVTADGTDVGSVTAGCLEDDIRALAMDVLRKGTPRLETYDLMEEDDVWGLGVGCNGIIDVLLEPIGERHRLAVESLEAGASVASIVVLDGDVPAGTRVYYDSDAGFTTGDAGTAGSGDAVFPDWLRAELTGPADDLLRRGRASRVTVETDAGDAVVFVDGLTPPPELVVFGTGHDVRPVVEFASRCGFRVTVLGFRGASAIEERFPRADRVQSTSPASIRDVHDFEENTSAVVMTHNFVDDRLTVEELLETPVPYIGLMGPRERFEEMTEAFADEGRTLTAAERDRLYTPIGLDLGGGTPSQIALAVVAEVLSVHNGTVPDHLKSLEGPIHDRLTLE